MPEEKQNDKPEHEEATDSTRSPVRYMLLGLGFSALISWLVIGALSGPKLDYKVGDLVRAEVVAPEPLSLIDEQRTEQARSAAASKIDPIYDYDPSNSRSLVEQFRASIDSLRASYQQETKDGQTVTPEEFASRHASQFPFGDQSFLAVFARREFDPQFVSEVVEILQNRLSGNIIGDDQPAVSELRVRDTETQTIASLFFRDVVRLSDAKLGIIDDVRELRGLTANERQALEAGIGSLASVTLTPNYKLTIAARQEARESIPPVKDEYRMGQIIAFQNQEVDAKTARALAELASRRSAPQQLARGIGLLIFVAILLYAFWHFAASGLRTGLSQKRAFVLVSVMLLLQIALVRFGVEIAIRFDTIPVTANDVGLLYVYAVPFAVAPLVIALLVDGALALVVGLAAVPLFSLLASSQQAGGTSIAIFAAISSLAAVRSALTYHSRLVVVMASLYMMAANSIAAIALTLLSGDILIEPRAHLAIIGLAALGALLSAALAALILPVLEWGFDILTDVRLLELANADRKVLRELAMRAPGTHQHSYLVGSLATEAANAIGANALLARIGAYYHDIGKLHAPHMFVENQRGGPNPHDDLDPSESARYIIDHVSNGVARAKQDGLPVQIQELITGHHGTRTLHYFLEKARRLAKDDETIDEGSFRYPGPKPQSREAAILMIADGAEAAVRSLDDPTREQIERIVGKIVDAIVSDGQLDESGITIAEIATVRETIVEALLNLYHRRISYPGFNPPNKLTHPTPEEMTIEQEFASGK